MLTLLAALCVLASALPAALTLVNLAALRRDRTTRAVARPSYRS